MASAGFYRSDRTTDVAHAPGSARTWHSADTEARPNYKLGRSVLKWRWQPQPVHSDTSRSRYSWTANGDPLRFIPATSWPGTTTTKRCGGTTSSAAHQAASHIQRTYRTIMRSCRSGDPSRGRSDGDGSPSPSNVARQRSGNEISGQPGGL